MRVLQLAPFPFDLMMRELRRYPNAQLMWVQEEPLNMGAFNHVSPRIETCMRHEVRARCLPHRRAVPLSCDGICGLTNRPAAPQHTVLPLLWLALCRAKALCRSKHWHPRHFSGSCSESLP